MIVRFSVYVDGRVVDDVPAEIAGDGSMADILGELGESQAIICRDADARGASWRLEIMFPGGTAFCYGTDIAEDPVEAFEDWLRRHG